jgi:hypothetical protein
MGSSGSRVNLFSAGNINEELAMYRRLRVLGAIALGYILVPFLSVGFGTVINRLTEIEATQLQVREVIGASQTVGFWLCGIVGFYAFCVLTAPDRVLKCPNCAARFGTTRLSYVLENAACPCCRNRILKDEPAVVRDTARDASKIDPGKTNPVSEIAVFGIAFGLILGAGAYFTLTGLEGAPDLWEMKRSMLLGAPLAVIAVLHVLSGVALLSTKAKWAVVCAIVSAFVTADFYFLLEVSTTGFFSGLDIPTLIIGTTVASSAAASFVAKLTSLVVYALPLLLIVHGRKVLSYTAASSRTD